MCYSTCVEFTGRTWDAFPQIDSMPAVKGPSLLQGLRDIYAMLVLMLGSGAHDVEVARLSCGYVHVLFLLIPACRTHFNPVTVSVFCA